MIDTIIFDLDGTLVDTEPAAAQTLMDVYHGWNIQISEGDAKIVTGRTWEKAFDHLFQKYPPPIERSQAEKIILDHYRNNMRKGVIEVPGAAQAVKNLTRNFKLGLVSGSHRSEILFALDSLKITQHFKVILGAEDYLKSKPAPDGYLKALDQLKSKPRQTLVFEDSQAGIQSARSAGIWVVAITSTNHYGLDQSQAHTRVLDLTKVNSDWIKSELSQIINS